jgi:hypothetical protein
VLQPRAVRAILTAAALALTAGQAGCSSTSDDDATKPSASATVSSPLSCETAIHVGPLPEWARAGFTPPDQEVRYIIGQTGHIVGVLFGPLTAPPPNDGRNNKILWVSNAGKPDTPPELTIAARLNGASATANRTVEGGPGPSIVDMPEPGCWTFELTWSGVHDRVAVPYGA